jgi:hypothetical protein
MRKWDVIQHRDINKIQRREKGDKRREKGDRLNKC